MRGFRSHRDTTVEFPDGCVSVAGPNGAGKSSILTALDVALFGPEGRSLSPYVTQGEDSMLVQLDFEHANDIYRVTRRVERGKTTVDLEQQAGADHWNTMTAETAKATQDRVDQLLGFTRRTLRASSLLMQADGGAFCEADPRERRQILADTLGLDRYQELSEAVTADRRVAAAAVQRLTGQLDALGDPATARATAVEAGKQLADTQAQVTTLTDKVAVEADQVQQLGNRWERLAGERQHADRLRAELDQALVEVRALERVEVEAQVARERADGERTRIGALGRLANEHDTLTAQLQDATRVELERRQAINEHARVAAEADRVAARVEALTTEQASLQSRIELLDTRPDATCDRCHQHLPDQARAAARASLDVELVTVTEAIAEARLQANRLVSDTAVVVIPDPVDGLDELQARAAETASASRDLAETKGRLSMLEQTIAQADSPEHRDQLAAARARADQQQATVDALAAVTDLEVAEAQQAALTGRAILDKHRQQLAEAQVQVAMLTERTANAARIADQIDETTVLLAAQQQQNARLARLADAYAPAGIPTLILENTAIPAIEAEANQVLGQLGGQPAGWTVELRTQREKQDGGLSDTLDVVVLTGDGERDYRSLSGGERTRVAVALRLGVARVLSHRRGADCQLLALDEPDALDSDGKQALVEVLRDRAAGYATVLLISHDDELRDRFDHLIRVGLEDGASVVDAGSTEPAVGVVV